MKKSIGLISVGMVLMGVSSACLMVVDQYGPGGYPPVETFRRSDVFPSGGTLSLRNFDGNIEIAGWKDESLQVYAEKLIPLPDEFRIEFWNRDWKKHAPKIEYDTFDDYVKLNTRCPDPEGTDCVVDYVLSVPQSIKLRDIIARDGDVIIQDLYGEAYVDLRSGQIVVDNFSGSLIASIQEGSVQATLYDLREGDEVRLTVRQGDILLNLEADVQADLQAAAPKGDISAEFSEISAEKNGRLTVRLGEGGAQISCTAWEGDVRIGKIKEEKKQR
jgi:hypothetical protein